MKNKTQHKNFWFDQEVIDALHRGRWARKMRSERAYVAHLILEDQKRLGLAPEPQEVTSEKLLRILLEELGELKLSAYLAQRLSYMTAVQTRIEPPRESVEAAKKYVQEFIKLSKEAYSKEGGQK